MLATGPSQGPSGCARVACLTASVSKDCVITGNSISVVVPLFNEEENVGHLVPAVLDVLEPWGVPFELILVDDGSSDGTWGRLLGWTDRSNVHLLRLAGNSGQTAAMMAGFDYARGDVIVSLDGDMQNDPSDIPTLVETLDQGYDLVCGWRENRQDTLVLRKVPSWIANRLIHAISGIPIRDNGCSLKAYRRPVVRRLNLYSEQHRFIPALAASHGATIGQVPVRHHARRFGSSKYGISRTFRVLADLVTLKMITTFRRRPLFGFSVIAAPCLLLAAAFAGAWAFAFTNFRPVKADALVLPGVSLLCLATAVFMVMLGLVAEVAVSSEYDEGPSEPLPHVI